MKNVAPTAYVFHKPKGYDYRGFLKKHTQVSALMQDVLIAGMGAIMFLIAAIYHYESESMFTMLFAVLGILTLIYGLFLMVLTLTQDAALSATSGIRKLYGIRVDSKLKDWILSVCAREAREAKGVSLLFLMMVLGIGFLIGLYF